MKKIIIIVSLLVLSIQIFAFFPLPPMPLKLPIFDVNNPLQFFNQWTDQRPDFAREKRIINQIEDSIIDGEVELLATKNNGKVFSIFTESELEKPLGGVIVLHSRGMHANWDKIVRPVRVGLAEKGWETLSVQMPVLHKKAKYYDYVPLFPYANERIAAAIDFFKQRKIKKITIVAHGCGAHMAMSFIDKYGDKSISSFIGIGMGATDYRQRIVKPYPLAKMTAPIFDIFAESDYPGVIRLAKQRAKILKNSINKQTMQLKIPATDHYYSEEKSTEKLLKHIEKWLAGV